MRTEELVGNFQALSQDGNVYEVHIYQSFTEVRTMSGTGRARGSKRYALSTGEHVNPISDTEFSIVWKDERDPERITRK
ncbi:hypothetical protein JAB9_47520 [Janthinobacterium sp. HH107]|uniref:hypothetical protein n=1 Tax=Janthinobacterium sp. HH107 TaxID=1537279 RepID=UPI0008756F09|nr:hypothetical protein [Janthinobacterium sp. HH107]OEZ92185.1 hypothetical protein JAB9_47520 [Janthinobacterium sp. HH107]